MRIKVFQAATMKEAMTQVKDELGDDAVILHTKKIKKGGILGYGAKEIFEVTAALDEVQRRPPKRHSERLPTLTELQAQETAKVAQSTVPLPRGYATSSPALPMAAKSVPTAEPMIEGAQAVMTDFDIQSAAVLQAAPVSSASLQPQARPSQSVAKSYKMAGTEAAVIEAQRQANGVSSTDISTEPFISSFPSENTQQEPFLPIVSDVKDVDNIKQVPVKKVRRKKKIPVKQREWQPHMEGDKSALEIVATDDLVLQKHKYKSIASAAVSKEDLPYTENETSGKNIEDSQRKTIEALQNELAQMKAMLVQVVSKDKTSEDGMSLQQVLKQQEVEQDIIDDVILKLPAESILADKDTTLAAEGLTRYIEDNVQMANGLEIKNRKRKIAALLGPTGVGKTTTLAKIAAQCVLEKGISTAFITADTYRISAVEQLKTYADILGLPIAIVYTPDELKDAIQKFRQKQLILIDTAGRSQYNRRQMAELKDFLAVNQNIEKYLVLSATTKNEDAKDIMDKFSVCKPDKVIFTKTDETKSLGIILNILRKKDMRLSYLTNGQSVPDDIVAADAGKLAKLFLR